MSEECPLVNKVFSSILHILILFCVLCTLFILVVSKLERSEFNEQIENIINSKLPPILKQFDTDGTLKADLKKIDLDKIRQFYEDTPSERVATTNKWIKIVMIICNVFLLILLLVIGFLARGCLSLGEILLENVLALALIGTFEYMFFKTIASKFVPVLPSAFQQTLNNNLWK